jgi:flavin-dependent dehydrogenase
VTAALDAIVVGGGLAGAAAARELAAAGRDVVLLERHGRPSHKACGEFLTAAACAELHRHRLDLAALGAQPVRFVRIVGGPHIARARLPFHACSLSREVLDPALQRRAAQAGAEVHFGARVREVRAGEVVLAAGAVLRAPTIVLATGKHEVRGAPRRHARPAARGKVGFKQHLLLAPAQRAALEATVELHLFDGGYAGLLPLSEGRCNLSLVVDPRRWNGVGKTFAALMADLRDSCPLLHERLSEARALTERPVAVGAVPYGHRAWEETSDTWNGLWLVGDQAAVTPSFTGTGMAMALVSGRLAAQTLTAGGDALTYRTSLRRAFAARMRRAELIEAALATAWRRRALVVTANRLPVALAAAARITRIA